MGKRRRTKATEAMTEIIEEGKIILINGDSVEVINAGISKAANTLEDATAGVMIDFSGLDGKPIDNLLVPLWSVSSKVSNVRKVFAVFGLSEQHKARFEKAKSMTQDIIVFNDKGTAAGFIIENEKANKKNADKTFANAEAAVAV